MSVLRSKRRNNKYHQDTTTLIIKVERTGGFAGISELSEINSEDLPSTLENTVREILRGTKKPSLLLKSAPRGAADHYIYKISITDGKTESKIECNQYDMGNDLKSLIGYIERSPKKKN